MSISQQHERVLKGKYHAYSFSISIEHSVSQLSQIYLNALLRMLTMWLRLYVSFAHHVLITWQCLSDFEILLRA